MTAADRNRLIVQLRQLIFAADDKIADLEHQQKHQETNAGAVLLSGWKEVAQVWRERKAKVEDAKSRS